MCSSGWIGLILVVLVDGITEVVFCGEVAVEEIFEVNHVVEGVLFLLGELFVRVFFSIDTVERVFVVEPFEKVDTWFSNRGSVFLAGGPVGECALRAGSVGVLDENAFESIASVGSVSGRCVELWALCCGAYEAEVAQYWVLLGREVCWVVEYRGSDSGGEGVVRVEGCFWSVISTVHLRDVPAVTFAVVGVNADEFTVLNGSLTVVVITHSEVSALFLTFAVLEGVQDVVGAVSIAGGH